MTRGLALDAVGRIGRRLFTGEWLAFGLAVDGEADDSDATAAVAGDAIVL